MAGSKVRAKHSFVGLQSSNYSILQYTASQLYWFQQRTASKKRCKKRGLIDKTLCVVWCFSGSGRGCTFRKASLSVQHVSAACSSLYPPVYHLWQRIRSALSMHWPSSLIFKFLCRWLTAPNPMHINNSKIDREEFEKLELKVLQGCSSMTHDTHDEQGHPNYLDSCSNTFVRKVCLAHVSQTLCCSSCRVPAAFNVIFFHFNL